MKTICFALVSACLLGVPAFAQEEVTCGDYSVMDNGQQMETIARLESQAGQMAGSEQLTAAAIHEKLAADCQGKVDVLVIDLVKGYHS